MGPRSPPVAPEAMVDSTTGDSKSTKMAVMPEAPHNSDASHHSIKSRGARRAEPDRHLMALPSSLQAIVFVVGATMYGYSVFQRVLVSVMTDLLMADFQAGAVSIGHLASAYYYTYASMQIIAALAVDHMGCVPAMVAMTGVTLAGSALFALATPLWLSIIGRGLVGVGTAGAFLTSLRVSAVCFDSFLGRLTGVAIFTGFIGSILSQGPVASLLQAGMDWRVVATSVSVVPALQLIVLAVVLLVGVRILRRRNQQRADLPLVVVRNQQGMQEAGLAPTTAQAVLPGAGTGTGTSTSAQPTTDKPSAPLSTRQRLRAVLCNKQTLVLAAFAFLNSVGFTTFTGVWAPKFFADTYGMDRSTAAFVNSAALLGWGIGALVLGFASDRMAPATMILVASCFTSITLAIVIYIPNLPTWVLVLCLVVMGLSTPFPVIFALARKVNPASCLTLASGFVNSILMLNSALLNPVVGSVLESGESSPLPNGGLQFHRSSWVWALTVLMVCNLLALPCAAMLAYWSHAARRRVGVGNV